jgi:hypothetical protein
MGSLKQPAESLAELAVYTLKHAFYSLGAGNGLLVPFVMADSDRAGRILHRLETGTSGHAMKSAHEWLVGADPAIARHAFAWDGEITVDEIRWDAVYVEAGDRVLPNGVLLCQRYESEGEAGDVKVAVGEPMLVDKPGSRLQAV